MQLRLFVWPRSGLCCEGYASQAELSGRTLRDLEELGPAPVREVRRRTILAVRDTIGTERGYGAASVFVRVAHTLFCWGRDHGWIENVSIERVRALPGGHLPAWTAEEADLAAAHLPPHLARVVILARY